MLAPRQRHKTMKSRNINDRPGLHKTSASCRDSSRSPCMKMCNDHQGFSLIYWPFSVSSHKATSTGTQLSQCSVCPVKSSFSPRLIQPGFDSDKIQSRVLDHNLTIVIHIVSLGYWQYIAKITQTIITLKTANHHLLFCCLL